MKNIISKYGYKIKKIIKNFTGFYDEDLEQEVYIKTFKNIDKYNEQNKFSSWIFKITANVCKDYLKSKSFKMKKNTDNSDEELSKISSNNTPDKVYSLKERQKITLKAINSLPVKLKKTLILYEFEDYSYEQIAKKENIALGTVKSRINSARKILKEKLNYLIGDDFDE